ncbi:hypothetical protein [Shewanella algae]|uniref:hypothetical protein n=1 Tax=Shewanella algae TaxID=38313 RepID=UPI001C58A152|nr:hypothetical protein [Shewanella algae]
MSERLFRKIIYQFIRFIVSHTKMDFYKSGHETASINTANNNVILVDNVGMLTALKFVSEQTRNDIISELNSGAKLYLVVDDEGLVAHFTCITSERRKVGEICSFINLPNNSLYIYHCFTEKPSRGRGCYSMVLNTIVSSNVKGSCFICCLSNNVASSSVIEKSGFKKILSVRFVRILGVKFYLSSNRKIFKQLIG